MSERRCYSTERGGFTTVDEALDWLKTRVLAEPYSKCTTGGFTANFDRGRWTARIDGEVTE